MTEVEVLKKEYRTLERNVLLLIVVPLPFFSYAYLYTTGQSKTLSIPQLPDQLGFLLLTVAFGGLIAQHFRFNKGLKSVKNSNLEFGERFLVYVKSTMERYWILLGVGIVCAVGLLLFENSGFTIAYAICLFIISLSKPTPERISGSLKLKKEEKEKVYEISKRDDL